MVTALAALVLAAPSPNVDESRMRALIEHLAAFNTRNTNTPELERAANWVAAEFRKIPGLQVEIFKYEIHESQRIPKDNTVVEVVATLPGATDHRVIVGGHMDSINMTRGADLYTARAPGANDDLSGVAVTFEAAHLMSQRKWNDTLVFVAFSGEEQGLLGSAALAKHAKAQGWKIDGVLSNDMVSNSSDHLGERDDRNVRVFSEESPNHDSRELARFIEWIQNTRKETLFFDPGVVRKRVAKPAHGVKLVFRKDRFGRGGDHTSFNNEGFTAVRFVEVYEEYTRQHTPMDLPDHVDFKYLANNARVNILAMSALADAPPPPTRVRVTRDQGQSTTLTWSGAPNGEYVVYWRETTSPVWEAALTVKGNKALIEKVNKDDHIFAVGSPGGIPVPAI
ncbi:MAG TPA: M28 family metallopeptidase [Fimbriimonadaceae bacterium]|nr:M28 family metallopeptidase [Fimbriimonadaceae bacterium]